RTSPRAATTSASTPRAAPSAPWAWTRTSPRPGSPAPTPATCARAPTSTSPASRPARSSSWTRGPSASAWARGSDPSRPPCQSWQGGLDSIANHPQPECHVHLRQIGGASADSHPDRDRVPEEFRDQRFAQAVAGKHLVGNESSDTGRGIAVDLGEGHTRRHGDLEHLVVAYPGTEPAVERHPGVHVDK